MPRDPRYDILFEPLAIGPVRARNRFYQVPHCNGGGYRDPSAAAQMRRIKAEGGWGVVYTEQVELHHTSEITPFIELRLWDDGDVPQLARMADSIHAGEALAGIELAYPGVNGPNLYSRGVPLACSAMPIRTFTNDPVSARGMTRRDIAELRRWHRLALRRAKAAGFDLVCLYAAHGFGVIQHFLSTVTNHRSDEYGGSLANRSRLLRELVSDARDEVGDCIGIAVRLSLHEAVGELGFSNEEVRELIAMHGDLPDLWDLAHGTWEDCSATSRFADEAARTASPPRGLPPRMLPRRTRTAQRAPTPQRALPPTARAGATPRTPVVRMASSANSSRGWNRSACRCPTQRSRCSAIANSTCATQRTTAEPEWSVSSTTRRSASGSAHWMGKVARPTSLASSPGRMRPQVPVALLVIRSCRIAGRDGAATGDSVLASAAPR